MKQVMEYKMSPNTSEHMMEVERRCRHSGAGETVYCLFRENVSNDSFLIRVQNREQCEEGALCGSLSDVSLFFEKIVNGEVPPYILPEVLEDYAVRNAEN